MFLGISWTEWLGYLASVVVAIALLMSSIVKLRWINLFGSALFAVYGFLIGAYPVGGFNAVMVFINLYFLFRIYTTRDDFALLEIAENEAYLQAFLQYWKKDMKAFFPAFDPAMAGPEAGQTVRLDASQGLQRNASEPSRPNLGFLILRNMVTAGVFLGKLQEDGTLTVQLDYATPQYRDYKLGAYLYGEKKELLKAKGVRRVVADAPVEHHRKYLERMGFRTVSGKDQYELIL